ncbi:MULTISPECIES: hypothetical protein [Bacillus]|nr:MULTISPECIES: hypothetical protein [Bacillus cereus group]EJQ73061.1 hypothetical protein IGK_05443 [Bacillus toyonensis]EJQ78345.1 hypothetical protein IGO_05532 [Bacillus toyonensis]EJR55530.1 hypothetical protein IK3_05624 [Bacillus toyonensis]EJV41883.1 hypothetical protein IEA_05511 [Bacillus toyonensis]EJV89938.1 hypothetical protein IGI_05582 [Bacillus toyonensis]
MKKLVLAALGLVIALSFSNNTGDTQHALKKEEIIQYSHADHF